jgi:2-haloacid dehalogenase
MQGSPLPLGKVEVLVFDVFGTVVDWRATVIRELESLGRERSVERDWPRFADRWRGGYIQGVLRVNEGREPWKTVDQIHREGLVELLREFELPGLAEAEIDRLNSVWHRLDPWPDAVSGLQRLRSRYIISTLSNGNVALLVDMARHARLPWDCVLSAELVGRYKPELDVYRFAARIFGLAPERVAMVAAHPPDLEAARAAGLRTLYVARPDEYGRGRGSPFPVSGDEFDVHSSDLVDLAKRLEAGGS